MKKLRIPKKDGTYKEIEYDETAPCIGCGKPVLNASCGGVDICPECDGGEIYIGSVKLETKI